MLLDLIMKIKSFLIWLLIAFFTLCSNVSADLWGYIIKDYDVAMHINIDWSMDVTEKITVDFLEERRGIYREIPKRDANDEQVIITSLESIWDQSSLTNSDEYYSLKIWNPDVYVQWEKEYTIVYKVMNAIKSYAPEGDLPWFTELYWNVVGNERVTNIEKMSFEISLDDPWYVFPVWDMIVFDGLAGETNTWWVIKQISGTLIAGTLWYPLSPYEWLSVVLKFPENFFSFPQQYESLFYSNEETGEFVQDNRVDLIKYAFIVFPISVVAIFVTQILAMTDKKRKIFWGKVSMALFGAIFFFMWLAFFPFWIIHMIVWLFVIYTGVIKAKGWKFGWWKSKKTSTVYFEPPREYSLPQVAYFYHMTQSPQIFVSLFYYRCAKWWVVIEEDEFASKTYILKETLAMYDGAIWLDKVLLQYVFWDRDTALDSTRIDTSLATKCSQIYSYLQKLEINKTFFTKRSNIFTWPVLTPEGEQLYHKISWYMQYLDKVEKSVLENEVRHNEKFINTILPWAALFGLDTKLVDMVKDILEKPDWFISKSWSTFSAISLHSLSSSFASSSVVVSRSSWSSWSRSGSSWGGWGWWWGGSW